MTFAAPGIGHNQPPEAPFDFPYKLMPFLTEKARYKVAHGGRGGAKSWSIARALIAHALQGKHLILCVREFQSSIADSVHKLLKDQIAAMGLSPFFDATENEIRCRVTGSKFIFKGLRRNINEIKSTEGVTIVWVEEAQAVSENSWLVLIPTIRANDSEVWISFNPVEPLDPTYQRFVVNPPPGAIVIEINWDDNPWFTEAMDQERRHMLATDPDAYDWIWNGKCRQVSEASIFRNRYAILDFDEPPEKTRFFFGVDWGFSNDPTALVRMWIKDNGPGQKFLFIDHEAFGYGVEMDDLDFLFNGGVAKKDGKEFPGVPGVKLWPIKADAARPETISYVRRLQYNVSAAKKWSGSVEDGIAHLKTYDKIYIHPRCKHIAQEFRLYSYKIDRQTNDILPEVDDKHNHGIDAVRYAHDGLITASGALGSWRKLARKINPNE